MYLPSEPDEPSGPTTEPIGGPQLDEAEYKLSSVHHNFQREPNRSVYNLIYENDEDDEDNVSHSTRSYLEEDDLPLPVITDSESSRWSQCGQCCDCCDTCLRKRKWIPTCNCTWAKVVLYYLAINICMLVFFVFVIYITQLAYYQDPTSAPFKQMLFKDDQFPGLSMVPTMVNIEYCNRPIIWFKMKGEDSPQNRRASAYVSSISKLVYDYSKICETANPCNLNLSTLGPCEKSDYGYEEKKPCIFLKLNRLTMWQPEEYKYKSNIPEDIPAELRSEIEVTSPRIWVHCKGADDYHSKKIGKIEYYPGPYFDSSYFPLSALKDTNPIIAIRLTELKTGYMLKIVCGLYAKNVHVQRAYRTYVYIKD